MSFTDEQKASLAAPLSRDSVKSRQQAGRSLSYIESWKAISEANRIFGFDGWSRETVDIKCVAERERKVGQGEGWGVTYTAKVRVIVDCVMREGVGAGHGIDRDLGQAHESAIKEAESDAGKRALMTFGNPFGLALYDKDQAEVETSPSKTPERPAQPQTRPASTTQPIDRKRLVEAQDWAKWAMTKIPTMTKPVLDKFEANSKANIEALKELDNKAYVELTSAIAARHNALFEE